ncbi:MAG: hypothetical protein QNJ46_08150 [Leptolyngbyaceae cyanobacterium MO_188.B28]|nr:hypothetical protein [Leptolyngbyaceae cyanobacterium MO_188.B28]
MGGKVEAIEINSEQRQVSITDGADVFYLEGLRQGTYQLDIKGEPAQPNQVVIDTASEPFQELNLQH